MKKSLTIVLQTVIFLIGIGVLAVLLWEPHLEGRNVDASIFDIYFRDPLLAYVYVASLPFFLSLREAYKILGYVRQEKVFSQATASALRKIRWCAFITAGAILAANIFLALHARLYLEPGAIDGPEGAIMLGLIAIFIALAAGITAIIFERRVKNFLDLKSEN